MDLDAAFLAAALPEPVILLHQRMEPYSLGHEIILRRHASPFLCEPDLIENPPTKEDLLFAVFVCCQTYDACLNKLASKELTQELADWGKLIGTFNPDPVMLEFIRYQIDGARGPKFDPVRRAGPPPKRGEAPYLALLLRFLCAEMNFTRREAFNCPLGLAEWFYRLHMERAGQIRLHGLDRERHGDFVRAKMAELGMKPMKIWRP